MQKAFLDQILIQIRHFREGKRMSQVETANLLSIGTRSYQRYESGESLLTIDLIFKLSQVLDFDLKELCSPEETIRSLDNVKVLKEEEREGTSTYHNYPHRIHTSKKLMELLEQEDLQKITLLEEFRGSHEALALSNPKMTILNPKARALLGQSSEMVSSLSLLPDVRFTGILWGAIIKEKPKYIEVTTQIKTAKGPKLFTTYNIFMPVGPNYFLLRNIVPKS